MYINIFRKKSVSPPKSFWVFKVKDELERLMKIIEKIPPENDEQIKENLQKIYQQAKLLSRIENKWN